MRSGGTSKAARHRVSESDLRWAEVIFVMEDEHKSRLLNEFAELAKHKTIHVLDIPDEYEYMAPELVEQVRHSVGAILGLA